MDYKGTRKRRALAYPGATHLECRTNLDSHADTCAFGKACYIVEDTGETVNVSGFSAEVGTLTSVSVVTAGIESSQC